MFKALLEAKKTKLQSELASLADSSKPVDLNEPIGRLSRMDAMAQQQMILGTKRNIELALTKIETALKRIELGTYGDCLECGDKIDEKRLKARPEATVCRECID
ncbi:MAG: molecular chaperone DnaK [Halobacteriovorax sp.]|nr:molecular chaperone DnaK [Halobacteriovorax sp.]|tara:strand:- start:600 stop:911 length:312 start_codon:yes stop_codon:yes gene_type:complete